MAKTVICKKVDHSILSQKKHFLLHLRNDRTGKMRQAVRQQGRFVIEALIMHAHCLISQGQSAHDVFASLFAKQNYSLAL